MLPASSCGLFYSREKPSQQLFTAFLNLFEDAGEATFGKEGARLEAVLYRTLTVEFPAFYLHTIVIGPIALGIVVSCYNSGTNTIVPHGIPAETHAVTAKEIVVVISGFYVCFQFARGHNTSSKDDVT